MADRAALVRTLQTQRLIVALQSEHVRSEWAPTLLDVLWDAGIRCLLLPLDAPSPLWDRLTERSWTWGVGPAPSPEAVVPFEERSPHFVVTAYAHPAWAAWIAHTAVPVIWTGATVSECAEGFRLGAVAVRLFPVSGWDALRWMVQVRRAFSWNLIPAGGVHFTNARRFLEIGALALEVDDALLEPHLLAEQSWTALRCHAREWLRHLQPFREEGASPEP